MEQDEGTHGLTSQTPGVVKPLHSKFAAKHSHAFRLGQLSADEKSDYAVGFLFCDL